MSSAADADGEEDANYEVEAILGETVDEKSGKPLYEIKWKGYPSEENTWEFREDLMLDGHTDVVLEYEKRRDEAKKRRRASGLRSKTPIKRTQSAKKKTPMRKPKYDEEDAAMSVAVQPKAQPYLRPTTSNVMVNALLVTFLLAASLAVALQFVDLKEAKSVLIAKLTPLVVGFTLLQRYGDESLAVSSTSKATVYSIFSHILTSDLMVPSPFLHYIINLLLLVEVARAVNVSARNVPILIVTVALWFVSSNTHSLLDPTQLVWFIGFWIAVTVVDRFLMEPGFLNLFNAAAGTSLLLSVFSPQPIFAWTGLGLLSYSSILRSLSAKPV